MTKSINIISQLTESLSPELLGKVAKTVGESEEGVSKALGGLFPAMLGGIMKSAAGGAKSTDTLSQLMGMITGAQSIDGMLKNPTDLLGALGGKGELASTAGNFVSMLFGDKVSGIITLISKVAGIKGSSVTSLLGLAAPLVMGSLGKKVKDEGLSLDGLLSFLGSQKSNIIGAAPKGLDSVLGIVGGLEGLGAVGAEKIKTEAAKAVGEITQTSSSYLKPALIVGALVFGALFAWKACAPKDAVIQPPVSTTKVEPIEVVVPAVPIIPKEVGLWDHLGLFSAITLPSGISLNIPELGVENKLLGFIKDTSKPIDKKSWFSFDRLLFETGNAALKADSKEQLTNIAEILKAYPTVKIKLGGYTDNTGTVEGNLALSQSRAVSVKKELVALGVLENRIEAEGYGQEHPVATNDTEEGRAQNRRIDVLVTQR